jgi:hypothetical protein
MSTFANSFSSTPAEVDSYVAALLELAGDRKPLEFLPGTPERVAELVRGLDVERLRRPEREGKWSIAHAVAHLADAEVVLAFRYRMTVSHDRPPLAGYDQDAWAERMRYQNIPIEESLAQFTAVRRANVRLLRSLTDEEWQRAGIHAERGPETVTRLAQLQIGHDLAHLRQIARIKG